MRTWLSRAFLGALATISSLPALASPLQPVVGANLDKMRSPPFGIAIEMRIQSDPRLLALLGVADVQSTEDFSMNALVYVYETESLTNGPSNSRSLILAIIPMDPGYAPSVFPLGIGIHGLFRIAAENGRIEIEVEEYAGYQVDAGAAVLKPVMYTIVYDLDHHKKVVQPVVTIERKESAIEKFPPAP